MNGQITSMTTITLIWLLKLDVQLSLKSILCNFYKTLVFWEMKLGIVSSWTSTKELGLLEMRPREWEITRLSHSTLLQLKARVSSKVISMTSMRKFQEPFHPLAQNSTLKLTTPSWEFDCALDIRDCKFNTKFMVLLYYITTFKN